MKYIATAVLLAFVLVQHGSAQQDAQVRGGFAGWSVNGRPLQSKDRISSTEELVARNANAGELMLSCPGQGAVTYSCRAQTCRIRACDLNATGLVIRRLSVNWLEKSWDALFSREPIEPVIAAARGEGNPSDAILLQDSRGVHWGPALTRVLEGPSCFRLAALPQNVSSQVRTFVINWDRSVGSEGVAQVPNVQAGLYSLEKGNSAGDGSCQPDPDATTAWVLVAPNPDFGRLSDEWKQQAASISDLERSGVSLSVITTVRHAGLALLAQSFPPR